MSIDVRALRSSIFYDGYVVIPNAVPTERCTAVLDAIGTQLGIRIDDPESWELVSKELDEVPMRGDQSQWDVRQMPQLHEIWSALWGTERLWVDRNACRFTPPRKPGNAGPLPMHWDVDPRNRTLQWYPGILSLTDAPKGAGGFRCAPSLLHNLDRWPDVWPTNADGAMDYLADGLDQSEIVEVPLGVGDLLIFDHHLPHGTVPNEGDHPRAVFYLQMFPAGTPAEAAVNIADHEAGIAPPWWRNKPGHDRVEPGPPATLDSLGRRLLGIDSW